MSDAPAPPKAPGPARTASNPGTSKVLSAARAQPLPPSGPTLTRERLKEAGADTALNVLSVLRETWEDFRRSDRFFKYKAAILAAWALISITTVFIARPSFGNRNRLDARLVIGTNVDHPYFMVKNASDDLWENVEVLVNEQYRATVDRVPPNGNVTLTPRQLLGPDRKPAPGDLPFIEIEIKTSEGDATLMKKGRPL